MKNWLRRNFQRIFMPEDEPLRREFLQFKNDVQLLIGETTKIGVDMGFKRGNTVIVVMSRQSRGDIIKHIVTDLNYSEVRNLINHLKETFQITDKNLHFDGPPGHSLMMREDVQ